VNINEARDVINHILSINPEQSIMLWGPPGVGKSDLIRQIAAEQGLEVLDLRLSQMDPPDLRGMPFPKDGATTFYPPAELPTAPGKLIFLDEMNAAPRAVMAAAMQLTLDRQLGQYRVPDGTPIIAAGNRVQDKAVANRMPSALNNRFIHIQVEVDLTCMVKYMLENAWPMEVIQFLRFRPNLLHSMPDNLRDGESFPSPRSWEFVIRSKALEVANKDLRRHLLVGAVGEAAMVELEGFIRTVKNLPNLDHVLTDPHNAPLPQQTDAKYAVAGALAAKASAVNLASIMAYLERFQEKEYMAMAMHNIVKTKGELRSASQVVNWMAQNRAA
jgi:midasin (ATPase involved in ribosome maturation)